MVATAAHPWAAQTAFQSATQPFVTLAATLTSLWDAETDTDAVADTLALAVLDKLSLMLAVAEMLPLLVTLEDADTLEVSVCTKGRCSATQNETEKKTQNNDSPLKAAATTRPPLWS